MRKDRFGFEPEVTAKLARLQVSHLRSRHLLFRPHLREGKKIGWKDGVRALWCILKYRPGRGRMPFVMKPATSAAPTDQVTAPAGTTNRGSRVSRSEHVDPVSARLDSRFAPWTLLLFATTGLVFTLLWTMWARTEQNPNRFNSIVAMTDGTARPPFVYRRLYIDATRFVAWAVPDRVWDAIRTRTETDARLRDVLVRRLTWEQLQDHPILISATIVIWISIVGFMSAARRHAESV